MKKEFIIFHKAWYYKANDPTETAREINIQIGESELLLKWIDLGDRTGMVPQLQVFNDGFKAFADCPELFACLADLHEKRLSIERVAKLLAELGFADATAVENPRK